MKIAAIYDIHGNLPALEAVLRDIEAEDPDLIVVGGDVAAGPLPRETIVRLRNLSAPARFIRGNADRMLVTRFDEVQSGILPPDTSKFPLTWIAQEITVAQREFLASFEETAVLPVGTLGDVLFCHATPRSDEEHFTVLTADARLQEIFTGIEQPTVVCGHTHMQFDRPFGAMRLVNAGSVGMPYGKPGAYWVMLGPDVQLRHTAYDLENAALRIRQSGYPRAGDFAAHNVLEPPSEAEALAFFAQ